MTRLFVLYVSRYFLKHKLWLIFFFNGKNNYFRQAILQIVIPLLMFQEMRNDSPSGAFSNTGKIISNTSTCKFLMLKFNKYFDLLVAYAFKSLLKLNILNVVPQYPFKYVFNPYLIYFLQKPIKLIGYLALFLHRKAHKFYSGFIKS